MKNVLLSTLGGSPKTVTQMFQKLAFEKIEIAEIHVLKTKGSRPVPEPYHPDSVLWREHGTDSMDIRTEEDARAIADLIFRTLRDLKSRPDVDRVILDLTGGRKEMSSYLMLCAQLLCSDRDEMYHVEVNDEKSPLRDIKNPAYESYYFPKLPDEVTLIRVPFVRLSSLFQSVGTSQTESLWEYLEQCRQCLERLALAGLLSAGIDHEICAPLGEAYREAPKIQPVLDEISGITHSFARVVKPEKYCREREKVVLSDVVAQLRQIVARRLDDLEVDGDIPPLAVAGNKILLLRVLWILAKNAQKHGEATKLHIAVEKADNSDSNVAITISNNGNKMEAQVMAEAFQVFKSYRAPREGEQVGLPTVKALMQCMGGEVNIVGSDERKTTFRLLLNKD